MDRRKQQCVLSQTSNLTKITLTTPVTLMVPVNARIWKNLDTDMFISEVVGSVSIGLNKERTEKYVVVAN
jgi:hypothetical protein